MNTAMNTDYTDKRAGLTLVELLVVIAVMALLTALIVPQVRLINKDRNIREAARVAGTALTQARDRAIATGAAGLMIERNTNLVDGNNAYYGGTRLYLMRNVPNYVDDHGQGAEVMSGVGGGYVVKIRKPWEQDQQQVIRVGDKIRLNNSSVRYRIMSVSPGVDMLGNPALVLTLDAGQPVLPGNVAVSPLPAPRTGNGIPYTIERMPRKMKSSRIDLPEGYIIDLRYSGYWDGVNHGGTGQTTEFAIAGDSTPVELHFGGDGSLDRLQVASKGQGAPYFSRGSVDLFVTEYRPEDASLTGVPAAKAILANPAALWVTLSHQTGGVNVGYNSPPTDPTINSIQGLIISARGLSRDRTSASQ